MYIAPVDCEAMIYTPQILLCLFEGKAHIVRGSEWGEFCEQLLGINDGYARELLVWARVERNIFNIDHEQFINAEAQGALPKVQQKTARALAKIPAEKQIEAYEESQSSWLGKRSVPEIEKDLQKIATRIYNQLNPATPPADDEPPTVAPKRQPEPVAQVREVTPILSGSARVAQAATYDDSEDEDFEETPEEAAYALCCKFVNRKGKLINFTLPDGRAGFCILED